MHWVSKKPETSSFISLHQFPVTAQLLVTLLAMSGCIMILRQHIVYYIFCCATKQLSYIIIVRFCIRLNSTVLLNTIFLLLTTTNDANLFLDTLLFFSHALNMYFNLNCFHTKSRSACIMDYFPLKAVVCWLSPHIL